MYYAANEKQETKNKNKISLTKKPILVLNSTTLYILNCNKINMIMIVTYHLSYIIGTCTEVMVSRLYFEGCMCTLRISHAEISHR